MLFVMSKSTVALQRCQIMFYENLMNINSYRHQIVLTSALTTICVFSAFGCSKTNNPSLEDPQKIIQKSEAVRTNVSEQAKEIDRKTPHEDPGKVKK